MQAIPIRRDVTPAIFHEEVRPAALPVVMKGLVGGWPLARTANDAEALALLAGYAGARPVQHVRAAPEAAGRLHYDDDLRAPNFARVEAPLSDFLDTLLAEATKDQPDALAVQGLTAPDYLPGFAKAHPMPLLPSAIVPRLWIGNAAKVATHHDPTENIACVAAGHRRFTLFPPDQVANLYMGPFHLTPAGTQVSMVHVTAPDLNRFPRFAQALEAAQTAELEPGDALYIPYQWYHHVEALDRVNVLVNYWWDPARSDIGSAWDALTHGMMTLRNLPADQRRAWRAMFDRYVFLEDGDPGEHLPPHARGILGAGATGPDAVAQMRRQLIAKLQRQAGGGR